MSVHRKEDFTWQLEAAFRKLMDFTNGPEESWKEQYGEEFQEKSHSQTKIRNSPKSKEPEKKKPEK